MGVYIYGCVYMGVYMGVHNWVHIIGCTQLGAHIVDNHFLTFDNPFLTLIMGKPF